MVRDCLPSVSSRTPDRTSQCLRSCFGGLSARAVTHISRYLYSLPSSKQSGSACQLLVMCTSYANYLHVSHFIYLTLSCRPIPSATVSTSDCTLYELCWLHREDKGRGQTAIVWHIVLSQPLALLWDIYASWRFRTISYRSSWTSATSRDRLEVQSRTWHLRHGPFSRKVYISTSKIQWSSPISYFVWIC